jgi:hypothetical protein
MQISVLSAYNGLQISFLRNPEKSSLLCNDSMQTPVNAAGPLLHYRRRARLREFLRRFGGKWRLAHISRGDFGKVSLGPAQPHPQVQFLVTEMKNLPYGWLTPMALRPAGGWPPAGHRVDRRGMA